jgi:hypothetical protein
MVCCFGILLAVVGAISFLWEVEMLSAGYRESSAGGKIYVDLHADLMVVAHLLQHDRDVQLTLGMFVVGVIIAAVAWKKCSPKY